MINVDRNAAYRKVVEILKAQGQLPLQCELRCVKYLNDLLSKTIASSNAALVGPGLGFFSFDTAQRTLAGYETMNMIRKGQVTSVNKGDILAQVKLINRLFGIAA